MRRATNSHVAPPRRQLADRGPPAEPRNSRGGGPSRTRKLPKCGLCLDTGQERVLALVDNPPGGRRRWYTKTFRARANRRRNADSGSTFSGLLVLVLLTSAEGESGPQTMSCNGTGASISNRLLSIRSRLGKVLSSVSREDEDDAARREQETRNGTTAWEMARGMLHSSNDQLPPSQGYVWQPRQDRFLLADCQRGQTSNRWRCYNNMIILAAFLNWTLVVPYRRSELVLHYNPRLLLPLAPLLDCYGADAILTTAQCRQRRGGAKITVRTALCLGTEEEVPCYHQPGWGAPSILPESRDVQFVKGLRLACLGFPRGTLVDPVEIASRVAQAAEGEDVVLMQDLEHFLWNMTSAQTELGHLPLATSDSCPHRLGVLPHPAVWLSAQKFIQAEKLQPFVALHWRRSDLLEMCHGGSLCALAPAAAAACVVRVLKANNVTKLFVASDGNATEIASLLMGIRQGLHGVRIVSLNESWSVAPYAKAFFAEQGFHDDDDSFIRSLLDKVVCALANVFVGTELSSFSLNIQGIRLGLHKESKKDTTLCKESPA